MNKKKLAKIKRRIAESRRRSNKHRDLEQIAIALERVKFHRGKEPTYVSTAFPNANPITIPDHGNTDIKKGTANSILNQLDEDVWRFEEKFEKEGDDEEDD
jgi:hypothetical protein